jgi:hypothetical protein
MRRMARLISTAFGSSPGDYFIRVTSGLPGRQIVLAIQRLVIGNRDIDAVLNLRPLVELRGKVALEGAPQTDCGTLPGTPPPSVTMEILRLSNDDKLKRPASHGS